MVLKTALLFAAASILTAQQSAEPYPLAAGNYWVYQGRNVDPSMTYAQGRLLPPQTKKINFRCKITKVVYRKGLKSPAITAAAFDNFPTRSGEVILLNVNSRMLYVVDYREASDAPRILRRVRNPRDDLADLLRETPMISMPLAPGKHWAAAIEEWSVLRREHTSLRGVRGAEAAANLEGFILETGSNTNNTKLDFVPGVGITRVFAESLFPRGDPNHWEFDVKLVEVHLEPPGATAH